MWLIVDGDEECLPREQDVPTTISHHQNNSNIKGAKCTVSHH
ncbi:hypothetical protein [Okeania sp. SIO3I5]|nr:hypothetical protein [Okeania sp. SIO3I5]